eukprot:2251511-Ditylum_brightwellii.AAC.1
MIWIINVRSEDATLTRLNSCCIIRSLTLPVGGDDDEDGSEKRELPRPVTPFDALKNRMASTEGEGPPPS